MIGVWKKPRPKNRVVRLIKQCFQVSLAGLCWLFLAIFLSIRNLCIYRKNLNKQSTSVRNSQTGRWLSSSVVGRVWKIILNKQNLQLKLDLVRGVIMKDCRLSCCQIFERVGISFERANSILTYELGFLAFELKLTCCILSTSNREPFEADEENFLVRFITMEEGYAHHYNVETKVRVEAHIFFNSPKD